MKEHLSYEDKRGKFFIAESPTEEQVICRIPRHYSLQTGHLRRSIVNKVVNITGIPKAFMSFPEYK